MYETFITAGAIGRSLWIGLNDRAAEDTFALARIEGWQLDPGGKEIRRGFEFRNFHETMAFVNAVAWVAHREDHHPELEVGYKRCVVRYSTHAVGGLSENDFICAAKIDALVEA